MNVYQICSVDLGMLEEGCIEADDMTAGNMICKTLARAQAVCQADDDELGDECSGETVECQQLEWTVNGNRYEAQSQYNDDVTYVIIKSKVF